MSKLVYSPRVRRRLHEAVVGLRWVFWQLDHAPNERGREQLVKRWHRDMGEPEQPYHYIEIERVTPSSVAEDTRHILKEEYDRARIQDEKDRLYHQR
jgi:hypothetical protein